MECLLFLCGVRIPILGFLALASSFGLTINLAEATPDPGLVCVQNQAQYLSIKTGLVDGLMGPKTRDASRALVKEYPELKDLRALTRDNAIVWCREIGLIDDEQTRFWPNKTTPKFEFLLSNFLSDDQQIEIQNAVTFAYRYFDRHNIHLAGTIKVIASSNETELAEQLAANSRYPMRLSTARRIIRDQCRGQDLSGLNTPSIIVLCVGADFNWKQPYLGLRRLITHEISHEIQRQMAGYTSLAIVNNKNLVARMGPRWLVEGSAIAFELDALFPYLDATQHIAIFRGEKTRYSGKTLSKLTFNSAISELYFGNYATLAGQMLANRKEGLRNYFTYWKLLARMDWQEAFLKAFGLTPKAFFKEFSQGSVRSNSDS
jgi:hypothetical protein